MLQARLPARLFPVGIVLLLSLLTVQGVAAQSAAAQLAAPRSAAQAVGASVSGAQVQSLSMGGSHSCYVTGAGSLWCWGTDVNGQLGVGGTGGNDRFSPQPVGIGTTWAIVAAGGNATCAIDTDGGLWCWGNTIPSAAPDGLVPTLVDAGHRYTTVSVSLSHYCAVRTDTSLWCWGSNGYGQLGDGSRFSHPTPTAVIGSPSPTGWTSVSVGHYFTCGRRADASLWCWGRNNHGQLGTTQSVLTSSTPLPVSPGTTWSSVTTGETHTCARRTDASLWCWGANFFGQLGTGATAEVHRPARVSGGASWVTVSTGGTSTCGRRTDYTLWCWGNNNSAQLGNGAQDSAAHAVPLKVAGSGWLRADAGSNSTCASRLDSSLWCWGSSVFPEPGVPEFAVVALPRQVVPSV